MSYRYERTQRTVLAICGRCGAREVCHDNTDATGWAANHEDRCREAAEAVERSRTANAIRARRWREH
jgi:hypothetical protein